jgi:hypothetical protein
MEDALASLDFRSRRSVWLAKLLVFDQKLGDQSMQTRVLDLEFCKTVVMVCGWGSIPHRRRLILVAIGPSAFPSVSGACIELVHT